ncbi:MAG TPA: NAD(P)-dependent oxidoreductase [Candidatus Atribacteria bacterium]|nr:NAD(P)-dependent oxidoreductase [Candidatus Atribacteria bacterium]HPT79294.1 NAD(P)-dependent oxidoreductase [Candidatus Atribacteria bacterium]
MQRIGFIGVGIMGKPMVRNLMKHGFEMQIYTRTKSKALDIISEGASWRDSVAECVRDADIVMTMVGYPKDVEEVYFGEKGILNNARKGACLIDFTTTSPTLSRRIYEAGKEKGLSVLDAPVSGGDTGARNATLSIMVGGDKDVFDRCYQVFKALGTNIIYEGPAGSGQHTKMANQIAIAGTIAGVCEALAYGRAAGLDLQAMLNSISAGAAGSWQMSNLAPKMIAGDYEPGFFIKHFIKDMQIAREEALNNELSLVVLEKVLSMYRELAGDMDSSELGTQALIKYYEDDNKGSA